MKTVITTDQGNYELIGIQRLSDFANVKNVAIVQYKNAQGYVFTDTWQHDTTALAYLSLHAYYRLKHGVESIKILNLVKGNNDCEL